VQAGLKVFHEPEKNLIVTLRASREERNADLSSGVIGSSPGAVISRVGAISGSFTEER
jgi:hypothetical protein